MPEPEILEVTAIEAVEHFRAKGYHVGFDWRDTDAAEHLRSFTVAKAMRLDILQDIRTQLDRALAEGVTFREFEKALAPRLVAQGWWGRQTMVDPLTGEAREVQLGSRRRLRIIYDTNLRMAHAHGHWQRIERVAGRRPWLRYVAVLDARTRPEHLAWHGTVLPWDHPFWKTHYPPNGWRCRCLVQQLDDDDLEEFGYHPSDGPPPGAGATRPWTNRRTGRIHRVPVGIDPGFHHNVGALDPGSDSADRLMEKIDATPPALARAAIGRPWNTALFRRHLEGRSDADWPLAILDGPVTRAIGAQSQVVRLSGESAAKQTTSHPDLTPEDYARIQRILDEGEVFHTRKRVAIGFLEEDGRLWRVAVKATQDGSETYLATYHKAQRYDIRAARRRFQAIQRKG